ncbi:MAG: 2Fe-2S iron-sulfur cluster-binding protein [Aeromicrobium sp.]
MPKVSYTSFEGQTTVIDGVNGESVMKTAVRNGVAGIVGECGGVLSCATCHVFVDEDYVDRLPTMSELEDEMLEGAAVDRESNSRLSCQITLSDDLNGLAVRTPEYQD